MNVLKFCSIFVCFSREKMAYARRDLISATYYVCAILVGTGVLDGPRGVRLSDDKGVSLSAEGDQGSAFGNRKPLKRLDLNFNTWVYANISKKQRDSTLAIPFNLQLFCFKFFVAFGQNHSRLGRCRFQYSLIFSI